MSLGQDHFEAALHILEEEDKLNPTPNRDRRALNWNQLLKSAARFANAAAVRAKKSEVVRKRLPRASRDKAFLAAIEQAREWADLELLMRTFKELGAAVPSRRAKGQ